MTKKNIMITVDQDLLDRLDKRLEIERLKRSQFINRLLAEILTERKVSNEK